MYLFSLAHADIKDVLSRFIQVLNCIMQRQVSMMKLHCPTSRAGRAAVVLSLRLLQHAKARTGRFTRAAPDHNATLHAGYHQNRKYSSRLFHLFMSLQVPSALLPPLPSCGDKLYIRTLTPLCSSLNDLGQQLKGYWGSSDLNSDPCLFRSWEVCASLPLCKYR